MLLGGSATAYTGFTGNIFVNGGTLRVANANGAGNAGQTIVLANNATALDVQATIVNNVVVGGTGLSGAGAIISSATGGGISGTTSLNANTTITAANTITLSGLVTDNGNGFGITKNGAGNLVLSGGNTFGGGVTLGAGTLLVGNNAALGTGTLTVSASGVTVDANGAANFVTTNNVVLNGDATFGANASNNGNLTFGGLDLGTGAPRTLTVNNVLTFNGAGGQWSRPDPGGSRHAGDRGSGDIHRCDDRQCRRYFERGGEHPGHDLGGECRRLGQFLVSTLGRTVSVRRRRWPREPV